MIKKKKSSGKMEIDLMGPQGNAYCLMGIVQDICKKTGDDPVPVIERMKSGDYENLVQVIEEEFGEFIIMYR